MSFDTILVPTDFSENSNEALGYAVELAERFDSRLVMVHVQTTSEMVPAGIEGMEVVTEAYVKLLANYEKEALETMKACLEPHAGRYASACFEILSGVPYQAILEMAEEHEVDLIVMGTHGRGPLKRFLLGSQADRVVRGSRCPVMTVRKSEG